MTPRATQMLDLCPDIEFPLSTVTEPIGIFGQRGYGKSWSAVDLVEALYYAGLPSVVIDVKGDWWGIRSSIDGEGDGLPFLIFGGDHADVPLEPGSARAIARFIAERNVPCIIDVSHLSKTKARQWVMEFAEELYELKRRFRSPLMVVVDEADVLIPQRLAADLMRLLGAMEDIAKRGRQRGLGICIASQRVADVNKSVTDLLTTLIIHNVSGARTRKSLMEWVDDHARATDKINEVLGSLSTLEPGEAWVWSPAFLRVLIRTRMRAITTFDSHATPEPGQSIEMPSKMADIPIAELSAELVESIDRAKADDPKELRKQIAALERQLREHDTHVCEALEPVEIPVLTVQDRTAADSMVKAVEGLIAFIRDRADEWQAVSAQISEKLASASQPGSVAARPTPPPVKAAPAAASRPAAPARPRPAPAASPPAARAESNGELSTAEKHLLKALVGRYPIPMTLRELGVAARRSHTSSTTQTAISHLRALGYASGPASSLVATESGCELVGPVEPMPNDRGVVTWWKSRLTTAEGNLLQTLVESYPNALTTEDVADAAGYSTTSSTFQTAMARLRSLGLATKLDGCNLAAVDVGEAWARG